MNEYIVCQIIVQSVSKDGNIQNTKLSNLVRYYKSISGEEAIGKFVNETRNISSDKQKLEIDCFDLSVLKDHFDKSF